MFIVLTNGYPFGGEPFLRNEAPYISGDAVYFALSVADKSAARDIERAYPIGRGEFSWKTLAYSVFGLFDKAVWAELSFLNKRKKLSFRTVRRLFSMYGSARVHFHKIDKILERDYLFNKADRLLIYSYWMDVHAVIGGMFKRKYRNVKLVTRCHGYDLYEYRYDIQYIPFRDFVFTEADLIAPISEDGKAYLLKTYGDYFADKVHVFRLGTKDYGLNPGERGERLVIVSCSSITQVKRLDLMVKILSEVKIPISWVHFGDGDKMEHIKRLASELLDEKDNISYSFMGQKDNDYIYDYYKNNHVDVFMNVSESEGIPVSIMEAMSFGIPVIATNVGGTSEIVSDNVGGRLIMPDASPNEFACVLTEFANMDMKSVRVFRENARTIWNEAFRDDVNYGEFQEYIKAELL